MCSLPLFVPAFPQTPNSGKEKAPVRNPEGNQTQSHLCLNTGWLLNSAEEDSEQELCYRKCSLSSESPGLWLLSLGPGRVPKVKLEKQSCRAPWWKTFFEKIFQPQCPPVAMAALG